MKFETGDNIIVRQTDEEGRVIEILNERMVMIEVRGVRFPAYTDQIDFPYFKMFSQKKIVEKKKIFVDDIKREKKTIKKKTGDGMLLSFLPVFDKDVFDDELVEKFKVYLVNQDEAAYSFNYELVFDGESSFGLKNKIEPLSEFYLHDVSFDDMGEAPRFEFEFSLQKADKKKAAAHEVFFKLRPKQLFKKIEETQLKNDASFAYSLFDFYPDKIVEEKTDLSRLGNAGFRIYDAKKIREHLPPARSVVDLHIEKLTDRFNELTGAEKLDMQLRSFEKYYDLAMAHRQPELTVIHGIGEGVLKDEIHELLKSKKEVSSFVNRLHPQFGYGATEIFFK